MSKIPGTKFHYYKYRLLSAVTFGKLREKYNAKRKALKAALHAQACPIQGEAESENLLHFPPGHYYSTIPSKEDVDNYLSKSSPLPKELPGIDLSMDVQKQFLDQIKMLKKEYVWTANKQDGHFYYSENNMFGEGCASVLYSMIRIFNPKRIIEIGSGHSTSMMVDTNRLFQDNSIKITCIEPYPCRLHEVFGKDMDKYIKLHEKKLQEVDIALFDELVEGDICFIDSSHVTKLESDVNKNLFEILPRLKKGVIIHFHDILYPFEYPRKWIEENWGWNEAYILRAFLQFNKDFEIIFWGNCVQHLLGPKLPLGGSIWLRKCV